jgi:hypothetical protein
MIKYLLASVLLISQANLNPDFLLLKNQLEKYGFQVKVESSPHRGSYGMLEIKSKTIWIDPVVFDLEIALPTLIHEATHAAQVCAGKGEITALALTIKPPNVARPFFTHYQDGERRHLEAEAYAVQTHPDALNLVMSLLKRHCS